MDHTSAVKRCTPLLTLLFLCLAAPACGDHIGDSCQTNVDCAQDGTRVCDLSQPGGYCIEDGCDETSCPSESICVRFFDQKFATATCSSNAPGSAGDCPVQDSCTDKCHVDELCVICGSDEHCCVPSTSERRYCAHKCGNNGDCRGGYVCRATETYGSLALLADANASGTAKFCGPAGN